MLSNSRAVFRGLVSQKTVKSMNITRIKEKSLYKWITFFSLLKFFSFALQFRGVRGVHSSASRLSDNLFVHRDTPEDNPSIKFEFTEENKKVCGLK